MAETRSSAWRAALASVLRSSACPSSLEPSGESRELVFSSVKNWKEMVVTGIGGLRRLTCLYLSRLAREEEEVPGLFGAPGDLQIFR